MSFLGNAAEKTGAKIVEIPINNDGDILVEIKNLLNENQNCDIVAISNTLGTINPIKEMIALAHEVGAEVWLMALRQLLIKRLMCKTLTVLLRIQRA